MKDMTFCVVPFSLTVLLTSCACAQEAGSGNRMLQQVPALEVGMPIIDAHCHYAAEHPFMQKWLLNNQVRILNIAVGRSDIQWRAFADRFQRLANQQPKQFAWCTSISPPEFPTDDYASTVLARLAQDFEQGAVACKIGKNVGMLIRKEDGTYLQLDDPLFEPIFAWMEEHDHPLIVHAAEPLACWQPLDQKNAYRHYYSKNPEWHMYGKSDRPHHSEIIAARDRVLERHPRLRMIGAHLGSLEFDVSELAKRFEKYPNFMVDTSGQSRIGSLARQDRETVRQFFIKYQDRIMFGSDRSARGQLTMSSNELAASARKLIDALQLGWDYYATKKTVAVHDYPCPGLSLPSDVLQKLFYQNANKTFFATN